jgi:hypothetical protein
MCLNKISTKDISFLPRNERLWIELVNGDSRMLAAPQGKNKHEREELSVQISEHIITLIRQFFDCRDKDDNTRQEALTDIVDSINRAMAEHWLSRQPVQFVANGKFNPNISDVTDIPEDWISSMPFLFSEPYGPWGIYESLCRFWTGPNRNRLGCCQFCENLFISPDKRRYSYCPGTIHRELGVAKRRKETHYHATYMKRRRAEKKV